VVLSTPIAESSITIDGVTAVVDAGLRRAPRYDAATGISRLVTQRIALDAAEQRRGRAGRTRPGARRGLRAAAPGAMLRACVRRHAGRRSSPCPHL
jgi:ATP-dependent helicase HrpB